jgi:TetR/AcrR family transcriptional repressor of mexJK operon
MTTSTPAPAAASPAGASPASRSARKRHAILEAATELFLQRGYAGTSMDDVAAAASASKQTVYKHFADKDSLFHEIVMQSVAGVGGLVADQIAALEAAEDVDAALRTLARRYITSVVSPEVVRRRLLVIREAGSHPDLAAEYYGAAPGQTLDRLAEAFAALMRRGILRRADPGVAARQFAFLVLGDQLDRAAFRGVDAIPSRRRLHTIADAACDTFLVAYAA